MKKILILILILALSSALLLSACAPDETRNPNTERLLMDSRSTNYFTADEHRPEGYNDNIGHALALMMDIYKNDANKQFLVIVGGLLNDKGDQNDMMNIAGVSSENIKSAFLRDLSDGKDRTAYYAYMTATQINALAQNDIKCLFVGDAERVSDLYYTYPEGFYLTEWWNSSEQIEDFCDYYGDMFALYDGQLKWTSTLTFSFD